MALEVRTMLGTFLDRQQIRPQVAGDGWVEGLPPQVTILLSKDARWGLQHLLPTSLKPQLSEH